MDSLDYGLACTCCRRYVRLGTKNEEGFDLDCRTTGKFLGDHVGCMTRVMRSEMIPEDYIERSGRDS